MNRQIDEAMAEQRLAKSIERDIDRFAYTRVDVACALIAGFCGGFILAMVLM